MEPLHIVLLLLTGAFAGFAGGMLGLGGAFIMTPLQHLIYTDMGLPPDLAILTAFGTSLLVVLPTSMSGAWRHHRKQLVMWRPALIMGVCSSLVAFGGATLASHLSERVLSIAFGIILIIAGARMLFARMPEYTSEVEIRLRLWVLWSVPVGLISGLFGVGGGIVLIPVLVMALRLEMHHAIGTSLAVIILTSIGGIAGYIANGIGVAGRLDWSIGYINLTSFILMAVPAVIMAQLGAVTAGKLPRRPLMYIFLCIQLFMSLKMLGFFEWLGWTF